MSLFGRRERREIAELNAYVDRLRGQRNDARDERNAFRAAASSAAEKYTDTCIVNECLTEDLAKARERLAEYGIRRTVPEVLEEHDVHRKAIADALGDQLRHMNWDELVAEVGRLNAAAEAWMADHEAEKKRADGLQAQLDDALGLNDPAVEAGQHWQARRMDKPHPAKETTS
jgi:hypothetical protein